MLASSRLVSLTGAGGRRKDAAGRAPCVDVVDQFPDGVWLVDLTPLPRRSWWCRRSRLSSASEKARSDGCARRFSRTAPA